MKTSKLRMACPVCASEAVFYSCTPNCCFNHVCSDCGSTFEPISRARGGARTGLSPPDPLPEAADPTVECARCESTAVYTAEDGAVVCGKCGALLELEMTEISPG